MNVNASARKSHAPVDYGATIAPDKRRRQTIALPLAQAADEKTKTGAVGH
jgi:hypothetical protein